MEIVKDLTMQVWQFANFEVKRSISRGRSTTRFLALKHRPFNPLQKSFRCFFCDELFFLQIISTSHPQGPVSSCSNKINCYTMVCYITNAAKSDVGMSHATSFLDRRKRSSSRFLGLFAFLTPPFRWASFFSYTGDRYIHDWLLGRLLPLQLCGQTWG